MTRNGFSRTDLAVTLAGLGFAVGLFVPAAQKARAADARSRCSDNLRRTGGGLIQYDATFHQLPPASVGAAGARRGWATFLLPHLGLPIDKFRTDVDWYHPANRPLAVTAVEVLRCPDSPARTTAGTTDGVKWEAATGDYAANVGLDAVTVSGMGLPADFDRAGPFRGTRKLSETSDGLGVTILLSEQAGRPHTYRKGKRVVPDLDPEEGAWPSGRNSIDARAHSADGTTFPGPCAVNCTNSRGVYAFHPGLANVCMADGSVRPLREGLDVWVYYALLTSRGGETVELPE